MKKHVVACRNLLSDRRLCGAVALVHRVEYKYDSPGPVEDPDELVLLEATYDLECPRCGRRTQVDVSRS